MGFRTAGVGGQVRPRPVEGDQKKHALVGPERT
jgi:hypothetical protein